MPITRRITIRLCCLIGCVSSIDQGLFLETRQKLIAGNDGNCSPARSEKLQEAGEQTTLSDSNATEIALTKSSLQEQPMSTDGSAEIMASCNNAAPSMEVDTVLTAGAESTVVKVPP